jgi:hypothetical protein
VALGGEGGRAPVPVTDIDLAKSYYVDELGFEEDVDLHPGQGVRLVRVTLGSRDSLLLAARSRADATDAERG